MIKENKCGSGTSHTLKEKKTLLTFIFYRNEHNLSIHKKRNEFAETSQSLGFFLRVCMQKNNNIIVAFMLICVIEARTKWCCVWVKRAEEAKQVNTIMNYN